MRSRKEPAIRIPAHDPGDSRQENHKVQASLGDLAKPCLKIQKERAGDAAQWRSTSGVSPSTGAVGAEWLIRKAGLVVSHTSNTTLPAAENLREACCTHLPTGGPRLRYLDLPLREPEHLPSHVRPCVPRLPHCFLVLENMAPDCWKSMITLRRFSSSSVSRRYLNTVHRNGLRKSKTLSVQQRVKNTNTEH